MTRNSVIQSSTRIPFQFIHKKGLIEAYSSIVKKHFPEISSNGRTKYKVIALNVLI